MSLIFWPLEFFPHATNLFSLEKKAPQHKLLLIIYHNLFQAFSYTYHLIANCLLSVPLFSLFPALSYPQTAAPRKALQEAQPPRGPA